MLPKMVTIRQAPPPKPKQTEYKIGQIIEPRPRSVQQVEVVYKYEPNLKKFAAASFIILSFSFLAQNSDILKIVIIGVLMFATAAFFLVNSNLKPTHNYEPKLKIIDQPIQKFVELEQNPQAPLGAPTPPVAPQDPPKKPNLNELYNKFTNDGKDANAKKAENLRHVINSFFNKTGLDRNQVDLNKF